MDMREFIMSSNYFKHGILDKVPVAAEGQCILLYQEGNVRNNAIVINQYSKLSGFSALFGRYNRITYLSMKEKTADFSFELPMKGYEFFFSIKVKVKYSVKDVYEYCFREREENKESIEQTIRDILAGCQKEYGITQEVELKNALQIKIASQLNQYNALRVNVTEVFVEGDPDAQRLIRSKRNKTVEIEVYENETDVKVAQDEQDVRRFDSENKLIGKKVQRLEDLASRFGKLAPIMEECFSENVSGEKLYSYLDKGQADDLNILKLAVESDLITAEEAKTKMGRILESNIGGKRENFQIEEKPAKDEEKSEENIIEYSLEDGDYL